MSFIWVNGNKKSYQWRSLSLALKKKALGNLKMTYWRSLLTSISVIAGDKRSLQSNLQVVITHASHVCSQHSFGLRVNGMHRTQFDHALLDLLSLEIWSREFDHACFDHLSRETFDLRSLSPHSVTFGYHHHHHYLLAFLLQQILQDTAGCKARRPQETTRLI